MNSEFIKKISNIKDLNIYTNYNFKHNNSLNIEYIISLFVIPKTIYSLKKVILMAKKYEISYLVVGNGSKIIFKNKYVNKMIILLNENFEKIEIEKNKLHVLSGTNLSKIIKYGHLFNIGGMEKLIGIPATLGGAIFKNAGAHNLTISDFIENVSFIDENGEFKTISNVDCRFSYRNSIFVNKRKWVIVSATLTLSYIDVNEANKIIKDTLLYRVNNQPINKKNCGSVFKNPNGYKAYELIQQSIFEKLNVNDAIMSKKHCNFIENIGNCTNYDVIKLISLVQQKVLEKTGILLEKEVEII